MRMETLQTIVAGYGGRLDVVDLGRRRRFSDDFKLAVVAESYAACAPLWGPSKSDLRLAGAGSW